VENTAPRGRSRSASALVLLLALAPAALPAEELDRIVLRVNDQIATLSDYRDRRLGRIDIASHAEGLSEAERKQAIEDSGRQAMSELFEELLLVSRAQQLRITSSREQVDRAVATTRERYGISTQEEFERALAQSGLGLDEFRHRLEQQLLTQEVVSKEVQSKIKIEDETLRKSYKEQTDKYSLPERLDVREVVVLDSARPTAEERTALAEEVRGVMGSAKDVAEAVKKYETSGATSSLVELGWIKKGELAPALESAVWALQPGFVSAPVAARGGLHILQVKAREAAHVRPFDEVKGEIEDRERARRFETDMRKYLDDLAAKAYIRDDPPAEAAGYRKAVGRVEPAIPGFNSPPPAPAQPAPPTLTVPPGAVPNPTPKPPGAAASGAA